MTTTTTPRQRAYKLISSQVYRLSIGSLTLEDLSDSFTLCKWLDHLQAAIESGNFDPESLIEAANEAALEVLEDEGLGAWDA